jgi:hypothetical protein
MKRKICNDPRYSTPCDAENCDDCLYIDNIPCPKGGNHEWGIDGAHNNEYCKKCFCNSPSEPKCIIKGDRNGTRS